MHKRTHTHTHIHQQNHKKGVAAKGNRWWKHVFRRRKVNPLFAFTIYFKPKTFRIRQVVPFWNLKSICRNCWQQFWNENPTSNYTGKNNARTQSITNCWPWKLTSKVADAAVVVRFCYQAFFSVLFNLFCFLQKLGVLELISTLRVLAFWMFY